MSENQQVTSFMKGRNHNNVSTFNFVFHLITLHDCDAISMHLIILLRSITFVNDELLNKSSKQTSETV